MRSWITVSCVFVWTGKLGHEILSHCELCVWVNRQAGPWDLESLWAVCLCEQASWAMRSWVTVSCVFVWTGKMDHEILSHCELCVCVNRQDGPWTMSHCELCVCVNKQAGPWDLESLWAVCLCEQARCTMRSRVTVSCVFVWTGKLGHEILSHCELCVCVNRQAGPWDLESLWAVCLCEQANWAMRSWVTVSCVFVWTGKLGHEIMSHCEVCVCVNRQAGPWDHETLWGVCLCEQASWTMRSRVTVNCVFVNRQAGPWDLKSLWAVCLCEQASWAMRPWVSVNCVIVNRQAGPWDLELLWAVCLCEQASWAMRSWVTVNCVFVNRQAGPWYPGLLWVVCICEQASWAMRSRVTVNCVFVNRQDGPWDHESLWAVCLCEQASWAMRSRVTVNCVFVWTGKLGHEILSYCELCVCVNRQAGPWDLELLWAVCLCEQASWAMRSWVTVSCVFVWTGKLGHEILSHCELCVCVNRQTGPWDLESLWAVCLCEQANWAMRSWVTVSCVFVWTGKLGHEILSHCELCVCVNRQAGPWDLESLWTVCLWTGKLGHDILGYCELCVFVNRQAGPWDLELLWTVCLCEQASWAMRSRVTVNCVFVWTGKLGHEILSYCELCVCVNRQDGPWDLELLWTVCLCEQASWAMRSWVTVSCVFVWTGKMDHEI